MLDVVASEHLCKFADGVLGVLRDVRFPHSHEGASADIGKVALGEASEEVGGLVSRYLLEEPRKAIQARFRIGGPSTALPSRLVVPQG